MLLHFISINAIIVSNNYEGVFYGTQRKDEKRSIKIAFKSSGIGELLGVSFTTVNRWENGKFNPSYKAMRAFEKLCKENNIVLE